MSLYFISFSFFFFFKQKPSYEVRISDGSSDVCSSDLIGAPVRVHNRAGLLQRGHVHLVDIGEVRDVALGRLHILGDLAAEADDLDLLVLAAGGRARAGDGAALVEEVGIEVGVADAIAGGLDLAEVDAEVARALADGGGGQHSPPACGRGWGRACGGGDSPSPLAAARLIPSRLREGRFSASIALAAIRFAAVFGPSVFSRAASVAATVFDVGAGDGLFGFGGGFGRFGARLENDEDRADGDLVADFAGHFHDLARYRGFHLDRGD